MTDNKKKESEDKQAKIVKPSTVDRQPSSEQCGSKVPEPTRYGDWEIGGKCVDF